VETKIKAIIVDDEESARSVLSNLITRFCPQIEITTTCKNVIEAVDAIKKYKPEVIFLDIGMPNYAGYEIVSFFEEIKFEIIFVTAYDQYAIKAFEISAVDYLLKPVEIVRLKESVQKLFSKVELKNNQERYKALTENLKTNGISKLIVRNSKGQSIINTSDIIAIEAQEAYSCIYTEKEKYLMSKNLKYYEILFDKKKTFFRTHKSWIINIEHIITFSKTKLEIHLSKNITAKLSKYRKPEFEILLLSE
jgi:two-component system LytT family response regulator